MSARRTKAEELFFEGTRALSAGDIARADLFLRQAIDLDPDFAEAHANLALVAEKQGALASAESCYQKSIALNPSIARTHLNLGALLAAQKQFFKAEAAYKQALMLDPCAPAWSNLGVLYACMKRETEAEHCYRTAIALDAEYQTARFNLSYLLLRQGRLEEGWQSFEARDWYAALARRLDFPRWQGESLQGKSLLIGFEAGHGDMIQFGRYAAVLKQQGARHITMICHPALRRLFSTLAGVDHAIPFDQAIPTSGFDCWTPPMSIPFYCGTRMETIPAQLPYLSPLPGEKDKWANRLQTCVPASGLRVGLVWKGNPKFENDADRSLQSLDLLAPLGKVSGVQFVSLQKGWGEDEAQHPPAGLSLIHLGSMIEDFADTAAIIANLDLVICIDTAVAHLTGAMGKPCWVLLPDYKTDWRWFTERSDSPWYPGAVRLFRQASSGGWPAVIKTVAEELELFARQASKP